MTRLHVHAARPQEELATLAFDSWTAPSGIVLTEFHRSAGGILLRFPARVDFVVHENRQVVDAYPTPLATSEEVEASFLNAVLPAIANSSGSLHLHASSVALTHDKDGFAIAFCGTSGSGKTTLAGACAKSGARMVAEDTLGLTQRSGRFVTSEASARLRVLADSAEFLLGDGPGLRQAHAKEDIAEELGIRAAQAGLPLCAIYVLGSESSDRIAISPLSAAQALQSIMPQAFLLDVEERAELEAHFSRMSALAESCACFSLDYPRSFSELDQVVEQVVAHAKEHCASRPEAARPPR